MMDVHVSSGDDGVTRVQLVGELDESSVRPTQDRLKEHIDSTTQPMLVDLSGLDFITSRGIGMLVALAQRIERAGAKMVLLNPQAFVAKGLKIAKLDLLLPIVYDTNDALTLLLARKP